ncbi:MAG: hypothetical protein K5990_05085 [Oscillospiraceae bacterium]|jgi:hypothetical protein|nr:hypothetical protein [Oscillospiraceae bacterium]
MMLDNWPRCCRCALRWAALYDRQTDAVYCAVCAEELAERRFESLPERERLERMGFRPMEP